MLEFFSQNLFNTKNMYKTFIQLIGNLFCYSICMQIVSQLYTFFLADNEAPIKEVG